MKSWIRRPLAAYTAIAIALAGGGIYVVSGGGGGGGEPGTANLWVDGAGSCTRQSTPGAYDDAGACSSPATAITAAQAGDRINIKTGTYTSISCTKAVEIHPAPGESVSFSSQISMPTTSGGCAIDGGDTLGTDEPNRIDTNDISFGGSAPTDSGDPTVDRIIEDVKVNEGQNIGIAGNHSVFRYGEQGPNNPCTQSEDMIFAGRPGVSGGPDVIFNVQIVGNYLHGHGPNTSCSGVHSDYMDVQLGQSLVAYNVFADGCSTQCIFNSADSQNQADQQQNLDIVGNYFDESQTIGIQCDGECHLAYNTFDVGLSPAYRSGPSGYNGAVMTFTGNLWQESVSCAFSNSPGAVVTHTYSMFFTGSPCSGTGNTTGTVTLTGTGSGQGRVASGSFSTVAGQGNPSECPAIDLDGQARPQGGGNCDVGADEVP